MQFYDYKHRPVWGGVERPNHEEAVKPMSRKQAKKAYRSYIQNELRRLKK